LCPYCSKGIWKSDGDGIEGLWSFEVAVSMATLLIIPQTFYMASIISPYLFGTIKAHGGINSPSIKQGGNYCER
jgi:hypothetical protein